MTISRPSLMAGGGGGGGGAVVAAVSRSASCFSSSGLSVETSGLEEAEVGESNEEGVASLDGVVVSWVVVEKIVVVIVAVEVNSVVESVEDAPFEVGACVVASIAIRRSVMFLGSPPEAMSLASWSTSGS